MLAILVISLVCWQMPYVSTVLYPFKLFVTTIHEACHALMARLTGGNVGLISISPDESGVTLSMGGIKWLVSMAGYIGTAMFGGLLIWMLAIGLTILAVSRKGSDMVCHMFLLVLAVQTTLSSVIDVQTLFLASVNNIDHSDAKNMETLTGIPAIVWSVLWGFIAVAVLIFAFWISYRPAKKSVPADGTENGNGKKLDQIETAKT
jgi:lysylphosphatidylglycerol synthetase-like protein (DUF2156 family)